MFGKKTLQQLKADGQTFIALHNEIFGHKFTVMTESEFHHKRMHEHEGEEWRAKYARAYPRIDEALVVEFTEGFDEDKKHCKYKHYQYNDFEMMHLLVNTLLDCVEYDFELVDLGINLSTGMPTVYFAVARGGENWIMTQPDPDNVRERLEGKTYHQIIRVDEVDARSLWMNGWAFLRFADCGWEEDWSGFDGDWRAAVRAYPPRYRL